MVTTSPADEFLATHAAVAVAGCSRVFLLTQALAGRLPYAIQRVGARTSIQFRRSDLAALRRQRAEQAPTTAHTNAAA